MKRVAIIAAMPGELKPLVRGWRHTRSNGVELWRSGFQAKNGDGREWIAACAGAGVGAATRAFAQVERAFRETRSPDETRSSNEPRPFVEAEVEVSIDALISTGWAGALRDELAPGQAYRVSGVIDARTGERFETNAHPSRTNNDAARMGHPDSFQTESPGLCLVTGSCVADQAEKQRLTLSYKADLVDMEAAGLARLAAMRGIPFYCVKGVSDGYSDKLPDFNRFISTDGQFRLGRFVVFALFRPWRWPALMRMGENSNRAAQAMAASLLDLLTQRFTGCTICWTNRKKSESAMATQSTAVENCTETKIPPTMKAVVYRGVNDMRLETVPVPVIGPGELLVKVATCGICGTDLKKISTGSHSAPRIFGHEMAGTIVQVGEGVSKFHLGERVMVFHHVPCGECYFCRKQTPAQCAVYKKVGVTAGFTPSGGGFSEYIRVMDWIVELGGVVPIPDGVPFEQAAFMEPVNTCLKGVKLLNLAADDSVLVIGQGPIGLLLAALSHRTGARVLTSDLYPERHALAAKFGLHEPIYAGEEDVVKRTFAATEGRGADAVILAVSGSALIQTAMNAVRPGGRVMLFAQTQHGEATFDPGQVCMDEKALLGSYSASAAIQPEVAELVFGGYRQGFDLTQLISHRFTLEEAVAAIKVAAQPRAESMKIMIEAAHGAGAE